MTRTSFPVTAVVGQEDLKAALLLHAVDPALGGVLIRGEKGAGKSTTARGLAVLLCEDAPFVELPLGATDDRVVGALDLESALVEGRRRLRPGLLAEAHGGILYADEVNLLPDHLVDVLLDAAASGVNRVERDGIAEEHPARFVLVGSMNPEEGELRPQLLDRFGLSVEVHAPQDPEARAEVVRRRRDFEHDPEGFAERWARCEEDLTSEIGRAREVLGGVEVPPAVVELATALCAEMGAEGLRADLVIVRGVAARAALEGRLQACRDDVLALAPLALAHRRRRAPFDEPRLEPEELDEALARAERTETSGPPPPTSPDEGDGGSEEPDGGGGGSDEPDGRGEERGPVEPEPATTAPLRPRRPSGAVGRRTRGRTDRGAVVGDEQPDGPVTDIALGPTVRAAAARRAIAPDDPPLEAEDLRQAIREARTANLVVLCVDASGSMGSERRMEAAKGAVLSLLLDAYQRRDRVALVAFRGDDAEVVLRPTGSVEVARSRLDELPTGGRTPLAAGIRAAHHLCREALSRDRGRRPLVVCVTDGRATAGQGDDPTAEARHAGAALARSGIESLVVDAEEGAPRLGLAVELAEAMGARYQQLPDLASGPLADAVSAAVERPPSSS